MAKRKVTLQVQDQVTGAIATGANMTAAAKLAGVTVRGLQKAIKRSARFNSLILRAKELANSDIQKKIFDLAMRGNTVLLIWWSKNKMGWADKREVAQTGEVKHVVHRAILTADDQVVHREESGELPEGKVH